MTRLKQLDLQSTLVTDLTPLQALSQLKSVELSNSPVTLDEVAKLQQALPNCKIVCPDGTIYQAPKATTKTP